MVFVGSEINSRMCSTVKETSGRGGRGGSMHLFDALSGNLGSNGIVGGGPPIAMGAGFANKFKGNDRVSVTFFGDGASNEGSFHEAANMAGLYQLPVLFVCEKRAAIDVVYSRLRQCGLGQLCALIHEPGDTPEQGMAVIEGYIKTTPVRVCISQRLVNVAVCLPGYTAVRVQEPQDVAAGNGCPRLHLRGASGWR